MERVQVDVVGGTDPSNVVVLNAATEHEARRAKAIVEGCQEIFTILDADLNVTYRNPAAPELHAPPPQSSAVLFERVHPDDRAVVAAAMRGVLAGSAVRGALFGYRVECPSGGWRFVESVADDLRDDPDVAGILVASRDITERQRLADDAIYRALHDPLTDLYNRGAILDQIERALARRTQRIAVMYLDLDHFKVINDTRGHAAGDAVLQDVATRLVDTVRTGDSVARMGGDEFVILCDQVDNDRQAVDIARRCLKGLRDCSATAGIAVQQPRDAVDSIVRRADQALYHAKRQGRGTIHCAASGSAGSGSRSGSAGEPLPEPGPAAG